MRRDFKIGMLIGLILISIATVYISIRPAPERTAAVPVNITDQPEQKKSVISDSDTNQLKSSESPDLTAYEQPEKIQTQRFHIVADGESLSSISKKYYGTESKWNKIQQANAELLKNPNRLRTGMKLIIPE